MMDKIILHFYFPAFLIILIVHIVLPFWILDDNEFVHSHDYSKHLPNANYLPYHVASMAIFSVLMLEYSIDVLVSWWTGTCNKPHVGPDGKVMEHPFGHGVIITSLFPTSCALFLQPSNDLLRYIVLFSSLGQACTLTGVLGKLQTFHPERWTPPIAFSLLIIFECSYISTPIALKVISSLGQGCASTVMPWQLLLLTRSFLVAAFVVIGNRAYLCYQDLLDHWQNGTEAFTRREFISMVLICTTLIFMIGRIVICALPQDIAVKETSFVILCQIFYVVTAAVLPGRIIRRGLLALKREMEYKQTFVRYINHEVRSPLSTISMGLECMHCSVTELNDAISSLRIPYSDGQQLIRSLTPTIEALENVSMTLSSPYGSFHNKPRSVETSTSGDDYSTSQSDDSLTHLDHIVEELSSATEDCQQACEVAIQTLEDLILYDKIECKMVSITTKPANLYELVFHTAKPFQLLAVGKQVNYSVQLDHNVKRLVVDVDRHKITQVIRNFLSNALKFTSSEGTMIIRAMKLPNFSNKDKAKKDQLCCGELGVVRVEVQDSGAGISQENISKLFGQYVQFDANRLQGGKGAGLGLWISKAIIEMHGGQIGATSQGLGKGSTFFFELPVKDRVSKSTAKYDHQKESQ